MRNEGNVIFSLSALGRALAEGIVQLTCKRVAPEVVGKRDALSAQPAELGAPLRDQLVLIAAVIAAAGGDAVFACCHVSIRPP